MNIKLRWYHNNILQTYLDISFILLKMTLIEERAIYYPYIILGIASRYLVLCGVVYMFMRQFGVFTFFAGLYLCGGAIAYGELMTHIHAQ
jgi:hypothetical protein